VVNAVRYDVHTIDPGCSSANHDAYSRLLIRSPGSELSRKPNSNGRDAKRPKRRHSRRRGSTSLAALGEHGSGDRGVHGSGDAFPGRRPLPGRLAVLVTRMPHNARTNRLRQRGTDEITHSSIQVKCTGIATEFGRGGA
jgi:hypothetical protein